MSFTPPKRRHLRHAGLLFSKPFHLYQQKSARKNTTVSHSVLLGSLLRSAASQPESNLALRVEALLDRLNAQTLEHILPSLPDSELRLVAKRVLRVEWQARNGSLSQASLVRLVQGADLEVGVAFLRLVPKTQRHDIILQLKKHGSFFKNAFGMKPLTRKKAAALRLRRLFVA